MLAATPTRTTAARSVPAAPPPSSLRPSDGRPAGPIGAFAGCAIRHFGLEPADLEINLSGPPGPAAVTDILARSLERAGEPIGRDAALAAPVGDRIAALLAIAAPEVDGRFGVPVACPSPGCGDAIEIELTWDELRALASSRGDDALEVEACDRRVRVRRPTGADQERWLREPFPLDGTTARQSILGDLLRDDPRPALDPALAAAIEAALDARDPLVDCSVAVVCPTCGAESSVEVPLTALAVGVLRRAQGRLLEDVHDLARAYGWTEAAILALPAWRRARYRALCTADGR